MIRTDFDHFVKCVEACAPCQQLAAQVGKIEVVLQAGLEVVGCQQIRQVIGFRGLGQRSEADYPILVLSNFFSNQRIKKLTFPDTFNRGVQLLNLGAK